MQSPLAILFIDVDGQIQKTYRLRCAVNVHGIVTQEFSQGLVARLAAQDVPRLQIRNRARGLCFASDGPTPTGVGNTGLLTSLAPLAWNSPFVE